MTDFSTVIAAAGLLLAIITFYLGRQSGVKNDAREMGMILTELKNIKEGVEDIKQDQRKQDENNRQISVRLAMLEASYADIRGRVDRMEGSGDAAT